MFQFTPPRKGRHELQTLLLMASFGFQFTPPRKGRLGLRFRKLQ